LVFKKGVAGNCHAFFMIAAAETEKAWMGGLKPGHDDGAAKGERFAPFSREGRCVLTSKMDCFAPLRGDSQ
jgi:hypothetical protein